MRRPFNQDNEDAVNDNEGIDLVSARSSHDREAQIVVVAPAEDSYGVMWLQLGASSVHFLHGPAIVAVVSIEEEDVLVCFHHHSVYFDIDAKEGLISMKEESKGKANDNDCTRIFCC